MKKLEIAFEKNPELKVKFKQETARFNSFVKGRNNRLISGITNSSENRTVNVIPIVFHIVLTNQSAITDEQIQAQLDTLNKDFSGTNADSVIVPYYFKPLFGKSSIQFCLAKQTPDGQLTSGIERISTAKTSFSVSDENEKHASTGGADSWDNTKYYNVWICSLSNNTLGYATFPQYGIAAEQGVVIDYRSLPGGSRTRYNSGKTLSHETGHYFNLYHIWGDDDGACWGTDYVDDTPNQAGATLGHFTGVKTDSCTPAGNGIMYQNYMDYTDDQDLVMFTAEQVVRMESALTTYRSSLLRSNGCSIPHLKNYDAQIVSIDQPSHRLCNNFFRPAVTIKNRGSQVLTSLLVSSKIDSGIVSNYKFTGSLNTTATTSITLGSLTTDTGYHKLTIYISNPNNKADEDPTNDTLEIIYQYYNPVSDIAESFEDATFPPPAWDIVNPDGFITWKRVIGIAKTGNASAMINNFDYNSTGQKDDLRLPTTNLQAIDSAFLSFQVAAATFTDYNTTANRWDTLEVLASTDCGQTYTSLYRKFGSSLATRTTPTTSAFAPTSFEWRKDSVNLINYIGQKNVMLVFRNTTGNENNIYLDDINLRTVVINPNLKSRGILITPNPTTGVLAVQFYPPPANLKAIRVYTITGQQIFNLDINGIAANYYRLNLEKFAGGTYVVSVIFSDTIVTRKVIKF